MNTTTSYPKDKIKILLLEGIHPAALEELHQAGYTNIESLKGALNENELVEKIQDVHLLGIRSKTNVTAAVLKKAPKLLAIGCFCIGTNQVDMDAATEAGVAVFNSPFSNTRSVAELVIAEAIILMRKAVEKNEGTQKGLWLKDSKDCFEVRGKTLGIIGYGHIGSQVSVLAESLGLKVIFYDVEAKLPLGNAHPVKELDLLLNKADIVTLHVPGSPLTKNMITSERIAKMKPGAILINLSRGDVLDIEAVKNAVVSHQLGGVGVDVFPVEPKTKGDVFVSPLQGLPNVFLTPHVGGSTMEAQESIGIDVAVKLLNFIDTGATSGSHSIPPLSLPIQQNKHRLLHIHKNVPGVLSEINQVMSKHHVNIAGQYLTTNAHIGYVVLDVDNATALQAIDELKKVNHTIKTRILY
jgi:D-3-phosphoglycerate dehydrogenase